MGCAASQPRNPAAVAAIDSVDAPQRGAAKKYFVHEAPAFGPKSDDGSDEKPAPLVVSDNVASEETPSELDAVAELLRGPASLAKMCREPTPEASRKREEKIALRANLMNGIDADPCQFTPPDESPRGRAMQKLRVRVEDWRDAVELPAAGCGYVDALALHSAVTEDSFADSRGSRYGDGSWDGSMPATPSSIGGLSRTPGSAFGMSSPLSPLGKRLSFDHWDLMPHVVPALEASVITVPGMSGSVRTGKRTPAGLDQSRSLPLTTAATPIAMELA